MQHKTSRGFPYPFGPSRHKNGINFALFSKHAQKVFLSLFHPGEESPFEEILLTYKTGDVWHIFLYDLKPETHYSYRIEGEFNPSLGLHFNPSLFLLDPYAKAIASPKKWGSTSSKPLESLKKGVVDPLKPFDWEEDAHPQLPFHELIIYEMHVRGFTQDPSSQTAHPGTFLGIMEKIDYLKSLGVNAVELLPLQEFDERQNPYKNPKTKEKLYQYWGYNSLNFFAPMSRYATLNGDAILEFKEMVKELHRNGIEVILDVVFNHTAEGNGKGPTASYKGIENGVYYMLDKSGYADFSGCGNTFNCNHPVVRELIREALRYWVVEMHVDGFRFDLASILTRGVHGTPLPHPPLIEMLAQDPLLAKTKLIAEAWDAAGLYQVGSFPCGEAFSEWNGPYRDDVRRFIRGEDGLIGPFATRLSGSQDLYGKRGSPHFSINFITAHDGFTLRDLVSYNQKHNLVNGEENRDGSNDNASWNCGVEGKTDNPTILKLRERQMKNLHLALMVSQGVPMLLMGDEYGHTKEGNNNSWGHDSRLNWFQWDTLEKNREFFDFYTSLIHFRKAHPILQQNEFLGKKDVAWHGVEPFKQNWFAKDRCVAFSLYDEEGGYELYIAFNTSPSSITLTLPPPAGWKRIMDTSLTQVEEGEVEGITYTLVSHSSLILKRELRRDSPEVGS